MPALIPADAVAIGVGAFFGAVSRYQAGRVAAEWIATDPNRLGKFAGWHTAGINVAGSFLLGGISAAPLASMEKTASAKTPAATTNLVKKVKQPAWMQGMSPRTKLMMGVGFCGSFTTFSTFSVDVVTWMSEGKTGRALSYVAANNVAGFVAAAAGMIIVKKILFVG